MNQLLDQLLEVNRGERETFRFMQYGWNIAEIVKDIASGKVKTKIHDVPLKNLESYLHEDSFFIHIDPKHAAKIPKESLDEPGIWVYYASKKFTFLIDGWHRAYQRKQLGLDTMKCYVITDEKYLDTVEVGYTHIKQTKPYK
jgi:hypothetical protein